MKVEPETLHTAPGTGMKQVKGNIPLDAEISGHGASGCSSVDPVHTGLTAHLGRRGAVRVEVHGFLKTLLFWAGRAGGRDRSPGHQCPRNRSTDI